VTRLLGMGARKRVHISCTRLQNYQGRSWPGWEFQASGPRPVICEIFTKCDN